MKTPHDPHPWIFENISLKNFLGVSDILFKIFFLEIRSFKQFTITKLVKMVFVRVKIRVDLKKKNLIAFFHAKNHNL